MMQTGVTYKKEAQRYFFAKWSSGKKMVKRKHHLCLYEFCPFRMLMTTIVHLSDSKQYSILTWDSYWILPRLDSVCFNWAQSIRACLVGRIEHGIGLWEKIWAHPASDCPLMPWVNKQGDGLDFGWDSLGPIVPCISHWVTDILPWD